MSRAGLAYRGTLEAAGCEVITLSLKAIGALGVGLLIGMLAS